MDNNHKKTKAKAFADRLEPQFLPNDDPDDDSEWVENVQRAHDAIDDLRFLPEFILLKPKKVPVRMGSLTNYRRDSHKNISAT